MELAPHLGEGAGPCVNLRPPIGAGPAPRRLLRGRNAGRGRADASRAVGKQRTRIGGGSRRADLGCKTEHGSTTALRIEELIGLASSDAFETVRQVSSTLSHEPAPQAKTGEAVKQIAAAFDRAVSGLARRKRRALQLGPAGYPRESDVGDREFHGGSRSSRPRTGAVGHRMWDRQVRACTRVSRGSNHPSTSPPK